MSLADTDRYDSQRVGHVGDVALVLGGSVAGLLAARVLADAFDRVVLIEQDPLEAEQASRRGVPQARHPHALLRAGQAVMEDLLPGFVGELTSAGAVALDFNRDFHFYLAGGFLTEGRAEIPMYFASRPLLEQVLRRGIGDHDGISVEPASRVGRLEATDGGRVVNGIRLTTGDEERSLPADLVVDATGRASRTPAWLEGLGYDPPSKEEVRIDLSYRTCQVERSGDQTYAMLIAPSPPCTRGAAMVPVEGNRWLVTLIGVHGDQAPQDLDGLRRYADDLPVPQVKEVLTGSRLASPEIDFYRFRTQTRHRYDQLDEQPDGLITIGDAVASFNPIYGQGMSVAALEALELHHALAEAGLVDLPARFHAGTRKVLDGAWNMAAGGDFQFPQTRGDKPLGTGMVNRYITRLQRKAHDDPGLAETFRRVAGMERPPTSLFHPRVAWRTLRP